MNDKFARNYNLDCIAVVDETEHPLFAFKAREYSPRENGAWYVAGGIASGETGTPSEPENMGEPKEESPIASALSAGNKSIVTLATMKKIGSTVMSFAGSHISTYTGSTALQNRINAGAQLVGTAISIVENPAMGLISLALDMAQRALEIAEEKRQDNIRVNEARKRAVTSLNSSRA